MAALSVSRAWDEAKARIAADGRLFTIVAAALLLLPQAIVAAVAPPQELSGIAPPGWANVLALIAGIFGIVGQIAIIRLAQVPATSVGEAISHGLKRLLPVLGAVILLCIAIFIVAVPLMLLFGGAGAIEAAERGAADPAILTAVLIILVLALLIAPKFLMMMPVATAERGGPLHIIKRSWSLSRGHYFRLLGFMLLILVAAVVIVIATQFVAGTVLLAIFDELTPLSLGALLFALLFGAAQAAFAAVISIILARIYLQLAGGDPVEASVPKSGT
jgi:hypothetical protein